MNHADVSLSENPARSPALRVFVASSTILVAWVLALGYDGYWDPEQFPVLAVIVVELLLAFLVGALTRSWRRAGLVGIGISAAGAIALVICSTQTNIPGFLWDEDEEWQILAVAQVVFIGLPLLIAALAGNQSRKRQWPRKTFRIGIPLALALAVMLVTTASSGAWVVNRGPYSTLIIRASTAEPARLDGVCYRFVPLYEDPGSEQPVGCTGDSGIPGEIALERDDRDTVVYRLAGVDVPHGCFARRESFRGSILWESPGVTIETIVFDCSTVPPVAPPTPIAHPPGDF